MFTVKRFLKSETRVKQGASIRPFRYFRIVPYPPVFSQTVVSVESLKCIVSCLVLRALCLIGSAAAFVAGASSLGESVYAGGGASRPPWMGCHFSTPDRRNRFHRHPRVQLLQLVRTRPGSAITGRAYSATSTFSTVSKSDSACSSSSPNGYYSTEEAKRKESTSANTKAPYTNPSNSHQI